MGFPLSVHWLKVNCSDQSIHLLKASGGGSWEEQLLQLSLLGSPSSRGAGCRPDSGYASLSLPGGMTPSGLHSPWGSSTVAFRVQPEGLSSSGRLSSGGRLPSTAGPGPVSAERRDGPVLLVEHTQRLGLCPLGALVSTPAVHSLALPWGCTHRNLPFSLFMKLFF